MSSIVSVALVLGYGPNVGFHVARALAAKGYQIAVVSRNPNSDDEDSVQTKIAADLSDPSSVTDVFAKVKATLGTPSVVVYNAALATPNEASDPLSLSLTSFTRELSVNTTSAFVAAQEAAKAFRQLPQSSSRTFIYTGNVLNTTTIAPLMTLGVGKSAIAHFIRLAAGAYADQGFKSHYADQRNADGTPAYHKIDGEAHGKFYSELADQHEHGPWLQTFIKNEGYKDFGQV